MTRKADLFFYTTAGCHLCEQAEALLIQLIDQRQVSIEAIDIAESEALVDQYGLRIPVVKAAKTEQELGWPFSLEDLASLI